MSDDLFIRLLLLIAGAAFGALLAAFVSIVGVIVKAKMDRKTELDKTWRGALSPLYLSAKELRYQLANAFDRVYAEKSIPEKELKDSHHLRYWFWQCKEYIVNDDPNWTDEKRKEHFAMHSGGMGAGAASTLYTTAYYLYYATKVRLDIPYIGSRKSANELQRSIEAVRSRLGDIGFYHVTQDSTGASMRNSAGEAMNFREFGEALTNKSQRSWFLTLTDVYYKLHNQKREDVQNTLLALDNLIAFLTTE
jgi:hypothetical protein